MRILTANDARAAAGRRSHRALVAAMCLGVILAQLDTSLVNLALHRIGASLRAGLSSLQWVLDSYNLVYASSILAGGTLGDRYGRKQIFLAGVLLFTAGSVVCAAAPTVGWLIAGRALTGLGAGLELPTSLAILSATFDDARERAQAIGTWASMNGLAFAVGPTLGGVMVDHVGWRSIFGVAVPVGLGTMALAARSVGRQRALTGRSLDVAGQILAAGGLALLAYSIIERSSPAGGARLLGLAAAGAVAALLAFVAVELRVREPLVPLGIFRRAAFSATLAVAGLMTFGMYGLLLLVPLSLQSARGASAFQTGLVLLPMSIAFALTSPASGAIAHRFGPRVPMAGGMALIGAGFLALAALPLDGALAPIVLALVLPGVGMGLNTGPAMAVAVASAPAERSGMASGLVNVARMVGATLGVAALGAVFAAMRGEGTAGLARGLSAALHLGAGAELSGALVALALISRRAHHRDGQ